MEVYTTCKIQFLFMSSRDFNHSDVLALVPTFGDEHNVRLDLLKEFQTSEKGTPNKTSSSDRTT